MKSLVRKLPVLFMGLLFSVLAIGCESTPTGHLPAMLMGMVYNLDRLPVADAHVNWIQNGKIIQSSTTDLRGHFALSNVPIGTVTLEVTKDFYETLTWQFTYEKQTQVTYLKVTNVDELMDAAAAAMDKGQWSGAENFLDRADKLRPHAEPSDYLRAVILSGKGKTKEAVDLLESLSQNQPPIFALELTMADWYQYRLNNPAKALDHLKQALSVKQDLDVQSRIAALEGTQKIIEEK